MSADARAGIPPDAVNHHGTAIVLGDQGVLITGPSGAGKTTLALTLLSHWHALGRLAALVADDQVFIAARNTWLVCHAPAAIAGLAEVRGFRPAPVRHIGTAVVRLVVDLQDGETSPRLRGEEPAIVAGVSLPLLVLPARNSAGAALAVAAALGAPPFLLS